MKAQKLKSLPLSRIDGGYNQKSKYREFQDNHFAIETVLSELNKYDRLNIHTT